MDQRSRATTRRRDRLAQGRSECPSNELSSWLAERAWSDSAIPQIDLTSYLRETAQLSESPAERLRQLAVHLESKVTLFPGLSGWQALERIYTTAAAFEPNDPELDISASISALFLAELMDDESSGETLLAISERRARRAVASAPDSARTHLALGYVLYFCHQKKDSFDALAEALARDPDVATEAWAHLYQAHVLHDDKRWGDALASYDQVDRSVFIGGQAWRTDVLAEQRAECLYMLGRTDEAEQELIRILDRYEKEPHVAFAAMSAALWRLAEAVSPERHERAERVWEAALDSVL